MKYEVVTAARFRSARIGPPHGEYSRSKDGKVDAYGARGAATGVAVTGGGVFGRGRFRLGVAPIGWLAAVKVGVPFWGVKLPTSRRANSDFVKEMGVLVTFARKLYGCGVDTS